MQCTHLVKSEATLALHTQHKSLCNIEVRIFADQISKMPSPNGRE